MENIKKNQVTIDDVEYAFEDTNPVQETGLPWVTA